MSSYAAKFVAKRIFGESLQNKFGTEDPYFEHVPATRLDGRPSNKMKRRKKALPPGISDHDAKILTKVKRRAYRLDLALCNCFGIQFGWGSMIGLIPEIGDVFDMLMALMVYRTCKQVEGGLPTSIQTKMMINIMFDFVIGLVPFVGDLADAAFKANTKNAALLESYLRERGQKNLRSAGKPVPAVDPSDPDEFDRMEAGEPPEYTSCPPSQEPGMSDRPRRDHSRREPQPPSEPEPARVREDRGFFSRGKKPRDIEMGHTDQPSGSERYHKSKSRRQR